MIPDVIGSEDGDVYWAAGHIDKYHFALAIVLDLAENVGDEEALDAITRTMVGETHWRRGIRKGFSEFIEHIRYVFLRWDPDDDELMHLCTPDHPDALPFTKVAL